VSTQDYVLFEGHTVVGVYATVDAACADVEPLDVTTVDYWLLGQQGSLYRLRASPPPKRSGGILSKLGVVWWDQRESRVTTELRSQQLADHAELFDQGMREYLAAIGWPVPDIDRRALSEAVARAWRSAESRR
jgi:hypothetical protein